MKRASASAEQERSRTSEGIGSHINCQPIARQWTAEIPSLELPEKTSRPRGLLQVCIGCFWISVALILQLVSSQAQSSKTKIYFGGGHK